MLRLKDLLAFPVMLSSGRTTDLSVRRPCQPDWLVISSRNLAITVFCLNRSLVLAVMAWPGCAGLRLLGRTIFPA